MYFVLLQVKVILKICSEASSLDPADVSTLALTVDKKKKQIALYEPVVMSTATDCTDDRKPTTSAPKMFAFEALFADDDPQVNPSL